MYSLGIMLWEMWYGKDAADYIQGQLFMPFDKAIEGGLRPSMKLNYKPPQALADVIEKSWSKDPEKRPSAETLYRFFDEILHDLRR